MKNLKKCVLFLLMFLICFGTMQAGMGSVRAADEEARIGSTFYDTLEEAFDNVQAGETITVLKDCSVSKTLEVRKNGVILTSGDADHPAVISRDADFSGKSYLVDVQNALLSVYYGNLTIQDIILDGGAQLDESFHNTGQAWDSPLLYVKASCTIKEGTLLRNNYNTDGNDNNRTNRSAGAVHVDYEGNLTMEGGTIRKCYTNGSGGGIYLGRETTFTATGGTIEECCGKFCGGIASSGSMEISGMTVSGNTAQTAAAFSASGTYTSITDCLLESNTCTNDGGPLVITQNGDALITGCTFTKNRSTYAGALSISGYLRSKPVTIMDCSFTDNVAVNSAGGTICHTGDPDIILDGEIVMEGNTNENGGDTDFYYLSGDGSLLILGPDFESDSTFTLFSPVREIGDQLVDAQTNDVTVEPSQFRWKSSNKRAALEDDGNVYLAEPLPRYHITYYTNNRGGSSSSYKTDPIGYNCEETAIVKGEEMLLGSWENFVFDGWNTSWDLSGTDYAPGDEITLTGETDLYARWKKVRYTLTYEYNGGEGEKEKETEDIGTDITLPEAEREGFTFAGWYKNAALTELAGGAGEPYQSYYDGKLYATWEELPPRYTVTFDADGGTAEDSVTAEAGTDITLPDCTREGYRFTGWYSTQEEDLCIGQAGESYRVEEDITLKARYEEELPEYFTVTYDADGGNCRLAKATAAAGSNILLPDCSKEDHTFTGWYTQEEPPVRIGGAADRYTVTGDITLKAHFEEEEPTIITITFNAMGGSTPEPIRAAQWDTILLPGTSREGYTFLGWYAEAACLNRLGGEGSDMKASEDTTLYALWEQTAPVTFLVTFDPGEGTLEETEVEIAKGEQVTLPLPVREGYTFDGWYFDDAHTRLAGSAGKKYRVSSDITFYAGWTQEVPKTPAETYTVAFDAKGGTAEKSTIKVTKGKNIRLPKAEKEGYLLAGWFNGQEICVGTAGETYRPEGDITLYAGWQSPELAAPEEETKEPVIHTGYDSPALYFLLTAAVGLLLTTGSVRRRYKSFVERSVTENEKHTD